VGDPPEALDAVPVLYALSILHVAGVRATLVLPRGCGQFDRALRHVQRGGYVHGLRVTDEPMSEVAAACDLGMCVPLGWSASEALTEPAFSTKLAVARVAGQGLPVLLPTSAWAVQLLPIGAHACLSPGTDHAAMAKRVFALLEQQGRPLRACRAELLARSVAAPARGMTEEVTGAWHRILARGRSA
jgi:protein-disulfide isomerase-like protein with CxxC motif